MSISTSVEQRLTAVEAAVAELQRQAADSQSTNWLQQITGSFKDEPAFEEVLVYGRAIRRADHPIAETQRSAGSISGGCVEQAQFEL